jgi:hypothetical protein
MSLAMGTNAALYLSLDAERIQREYYVKNGRAAFIRGVETTGAGYLLYSIF